MSNISVSGDSVLKGVIRKLRKQKVKKIWKEPVLLSLPPNISKPEQPQILKDLWQEYTDGKIDIDEYNRRLNEDEEINKASNEYMSRPIKTYRSFPNDSFETITYVENEKGEKFESTMSPSRRQDGNFIDGNKYSFYETFGLTTYTATDKLKVRVLFKDKPYIVELERAYKWYKRRFNKRRCKWNNSITIYKSNARIYKKVKNI